MLITEKQLLLLIEVLAEVRHMTALSIPSETMRALHNDIINQQSNDLLLVDDKDPRASHYNRRFDSKFQPRGEHKFRKQKDTGYWNGNK